MTLAMSPQVFAITSHFIEERFGLHYAPSDSDLFAERVSARAVERGFETILDYYYFLRYDEGGEEELQRLAEALVVHETYFFRESPALRALVDSVIPAMLDERPTVRLWSAACATGEEAYTLAIMLREAGFRDRVEILASDVSAPALDRARRGFYGPRSLRRMPEEAAFRHWLDDANGGFQVKDDIRVGIDWRQVNLVDTEAVRSLGRFDVILCRNVLIYFADATVSRIAKTFAEVLRPGGTLIVGTAESLLRFGTSFVCEERGGAFFYRRPTE